MHYFAYGDDAIRHLKKRDLALGAAIEAIGPIRRQVEPDLYAALVHTIIGQQISTKGAVTIRNRMREGLGAITPESVDAAEAETIRKFGMSLRKAGYIKEISRHVLEGSLDLAALRDLPDAEVCARLSAIRGLGVWTAEMLMTFTMQRPDILSWGDIAIHRGMRMLYRHKRVTRELFEKYRRRYSPYASVASLYLWAVAGGAMKGVTDPAPMSAAQKKARARKRARNARTAKKTEGQ